MYTLNIYQKIPYLFCWSYFLENTQLLTKCVFFFLYPFPCAFKMNTMPPCKQVVPLLGRPSHWVDIVGGASLVPFILEPEEPGAEDDEKDYPSIL